MKRILLLLWALHSSFFVFAQQYDSTYYKEKKRNPIPASIFIAPAALIGASIFSYTENSILNREEIRKQRNNTLPSFQTTADDYLQYSPIALALIMKASKIPSAHDWLNTSFLLLKTEVLMGLTVYLLKQAFAVPRPDSGARNSLPSGHTAQAFAAATFLTKEFGKGRPWVPITGYTIATLVGAMRVLRDRHWVSDVLLGAAVGILMTHLVYLTHEKIILKKRKKKNFSFSAGRLHTGEFVVGVNINIPSLNRY